MERACIIEGTCVLPGVLYEKQIIPTLEDAATTEQAKAADADASRETTGATVDTRARVSVL